MISCSDRTCVSQICSRSASLINQTVGTGMLPVSRRQVARCQQNLIHNIVCEWLIVEVFGLVRPIGIDLSL